jgi:hypothetical protein
MKIVFWNALLTDIAEQPDICSIILDNLGIPFYME